MLETDMAGQDASEGLIKLRAELDRVKGLVQELFALTPTLTLALTLIVTLTLALTLIGWCCCRSSRLSSRP